MQGLVCAKFEGVCLRRRPVNEVSLFAFERPDASPVVFLSAAQAPASLGFPPGLSAVAIGLAPAAAVAFAKIHAEQIAPAGGRAPRDENAPEKSPKFA
jgi:hypothetical protein